MEKRKKSNSKNQYSDKLSKATKSVPQNPSDNKTGKKFFPKPNNQFSPYLSPPEVARGLSTGVLVEGVLRINQKSYEDAFICSPDTGQQDIYIKGVQARSRALNGDLVVVQLDQPGEWKVNHEMVQDFLERKGTEDDNKILMEACIVNPKLESVDDKATIDEIKVSKSVDEKIVVSVAEVKVGDEKKSGVDISTDSIEVVIEDKDKVINISADSVDLIKSSVDPLEGVPIVSASDYESAEDIESKVEKEALKLADMKIVDVSLASTKDDSDSDVIVESTTDAATGEPLASSPKKSRRGKRGGKRGAKGGANEVNSSVTSVNTTLNTTVESTTSTTSRYARKLPTKPLVEYSIFSVLKHPKWQTMGLVQKTGRVVAIREWKHSRVAAGTIKPMSDKNPRFFLFSPTDSRVPRMKIQMSEAPQNFQTRPEDFIGMMFVARIVKWDMVNSALGTIERSLGHSSDIGVRTEGLLMENNIEYGEFPPEALANLPENFQNWSIPPQEIKRRRDFRNECVFTIDPLTARDLDDALSVTLEPSGLYRVGVHIADVSYFVRDGTALDRVAGERATSTYLVERVVPMLPRPLCENLCSLNPGEDRLTFTVEWTINSQAQIVSEWFGRTVIRNCTKLAYEHAQSMIDNPGEESGSLPAIDSPYTAKEISEKVNMLQMLAVQLRNKREQAGALRLDQPKLCFSLNQETGLPDGYRLHQHRESNRLIEEFMLLANMAVAHKIYTTYTDIAVLRRHPPPKADMMDKVVDQLGSLGVDINSSTTAALAASIANIKLSSGTEAEVRAKVACVTSLCSKPMELARYFCTGLYQPEDFHHYALSVPLYTHFTSPIRRYPDILVHRLLDAAITGRRPSWDPVQVQQATEHCNDKRLGAKRVGEASAELFLGLFIAECGPLSQPGAVVQVMDHSLDVLILEMGVVKRVYVDRLGVSKHGFRRVLGVSYMDLWWEDGSKVTLTLLSQVGLVLAKGDRDFEFTAVIEKPEKDVGDLTGLITLD
eukprot:GFUD01042357.1.p1 GENE.GFUD01042357.1~~GFUD01042357.1.p1  ORF type:complete len:1022 (-),score=322.61 GFUD01042357.1:47-3049(-)